MNIINYYNIWIIYKKMKDEFKIYLPSLDVTKNFASKLAKISNKSLFISLRGKLGSGKTTFSRFFINSLSNKKIKVSSPTFPLVNIYEMSSVTIWHYDLYRLKKKSEVYALDFDIALNDIVLVEWPEIIESILPTNRIDIKFDEDKDSNLFMEIKILGNEGMKGYFSLNE
tara:strand:- start:132 stop:641 length:510 start_codon:yes stop_codon:yes gene_type:complete